MSVSHERVLKAVEQSRANLAKKRGYPIYPESPVCGFVTNGALDILGRNSEFTAHEFRVPNGDHVVLRTKTKVYDGQYQQFIPPEKREGLPDTLVVELTKFRRLKLKLQSLGMNKPTAKAYAKAVLK